jgi:hypothetical protein
MLFDSTIDPVMMLATIKCPNRQRIQIMNELREKSNPEKVIRFKGKVAADMCDNRFTDTVRSAKNTIAGYPIETSSIGSSNTEKSKRRGRDLTYFGYPDTKSLSDAAKAFLEGGLQSL